MNSALHDDKQFKSKTRSQRRKLGLLKDKNWIPAGGYKLIDVCLLEKMLEKCCICKYCKKVRGKIEIEEHLGARRGLAECIIFTCKYCNKETVLHSSKKVKGGSSAFDVNIRSTCFVTLWSRRTCKVLFSNGLATTDSATVLYKGNGHTCNRINTVSRSSDERIHTKANRYNYGQVSG